MTVFPNLCFRTGFATTVSFYFVLQNCSEDVTYCSETSSHSCVRQFGFFFFTFPPPPSPLCFADGNLSRGFSCACAEPFSVIVAESGISSVTHSLKMNFAFPRYSSLTASNLFLAENSPRVIRPFFHLFMRYDCSFIYHPVCKHRNKYVAYFRGLFWTPNRTSL